MDKARIARPDSKFRVSGLSVQLRAVSGSLDLLLKVLEFYKVVEHTSTVWLSQGLPGPDHKHFTCLTAVDIIKVESNIASSQPMSKQH